MGELPELGHLHRKQIASLVGLAPCNHDRGTLRGQRHLRGGRSAVRATLYMAARVARQRNPTIRAFYERLLAAGKAKKVALTACRRKLLTTLNTLVTSGQRWEAKPRAAP
jgi:transposase